MRDTGSDGFHALYPSSYRSVAQARHAVADFAIDCGFDFADVCDISLAVGEALNNATEHGHASGGKFGLACSFDGVDLVIEVSDQGAGFDVAKLLAKSDMPSPERGMGVLLMRSLMDRVEHDCSRGGTVVTLIKRRRLR
ncbi:MAG TPA: ATP-binding protein [Candidatus Cybelea sp.]|nr:ATP-binding protein [Candidatus Cybelea sp.]HZV80369.1 ATP-binding protein [Candidatus Binatus sp.]